MLFVFRCLVDLLPSCRIHYWKWSVGVSNWYCWIVYFSPHFCQFLFPSIKIFISVIVLFQHQNFHLVLLYNFSSLILCIWCDIAIIPSFISLHVCVCVCVCVSRSLVSDSLWPHGLYFTRLLCPWNCPGKNTGAGCNSFLQGIFLTQEPASPSLQADSLPSQPLGKPYGFLNSLNILKKATLSFSC